MWLRRKRIQGQGLSRAFHVGGQETRMKGKGMCRKPGFRLASLRGGMGSEKDRCIIEATNCLGKHPCGLKSQGSNSSLRGTRSCCIKEMLAETCSVGDLTDRLIQRARHIWPKVCKPQGKLARAPQQLKTGPRMQTPAHYYLQGWPQSAQKPKQMGPRMQNIGDYNRLQRIWICGWSP